MNRRQLLQGIGAAGAVIATKPALGQLIPMMLEPDHTKSPWAAFFNSGRDTDTMPTGIMNPQLGLSFLGPNFPNSLTPNLNSSNYGNFLAWIRTRSEPLLGVARGSELIFGSQLSGAGEVFSIRLIPAGYYPTIENGGNPQEFPMTAISVLITNPHTIGSWAEFIVEPFIDLIDFTWQQIGIFVNPSGAPVGSGPMTIKATQMLQGYTPSLLNVYQVPSPGQRLTRPPVFWIPWATSSLYLGSMEPTFASQSLTQAIYGAYDGYMAQPFLETNVPVDPASSLMNNPGFIYDRAGNALVDPILPNQSLPPAMHLSGPASHFYYNHGEPPLDTLTLNPEQPFGPIPGFSPLNFNGSVVIEDLNVIDQNVGDPFDHGVIGNPGGGDP